MIIAYQGVPGAFGHQAALHAFADAEVIACPSFGDVVQSVSDQKADAGVLPVENHYAGAVPDVAGLIANGGVEVGRLFDLPIRLHLLGLPGARLDGLTTVASHPMALLQCRQTLAATDLVQIEAPNTAIAARSLSDPSHAVIASDTAAELYNLEILRADMQDDPDNRTTFAVIRRR